MDDPEALTEAVEELADTLEALQYELSNTSHQPRGIPNPPSIRDILRFTERYAIPTIITILQANIKMLELLAAVLRATDGNKISESHRSQVEQISQTTLKSLDSALSDLQQAVEGGEPSSPEVKRLLTEAQSLREEINSKLTAATAENDGRETEQFQDSSSQSGKSEPDTTVEIDVDSELESIKEELDEINANTSSEEDNDSDHTEDNN